MKRAPYGLILILSLVLTLLLGSASQAFSDTKEEEEELFLVAQKAFDDGFHDVAIRYIEQFLQKYPQTEKQIQARLLLGQCYFFKSQYLKAFDIFQGLAQYSEFKDVTLFWLGETYFKGSDYKQAIKHYEQLIELYPSSAYIPQAYYSMGWTYFEKGDYLKAKEMFLKLIKSFPMHQLSEDASFKLGECEYNLGNYEIAIQYFKNYVLKYTQSTRHAEAFFYIAEAYYYQEDFLTAITYYARAADIAYDHKISFMAKVSMGWCYLKLGKHDLSQTAFNEAQQISREKNIMSDDIFLGQANLYTEMGENEKALKAYTDLINNFENSPRVVEAHLGKANIHYILKDYQKAVEEYRWIIEKYDKDPARAEVVEKAYYGLAWTFLKSGDIDRSIKTFEVIMNKTADNNVKVSALTQIGDAYQDIDELQKAIDVYDRILKDYPGSITADYVQFRQAIALLKLNKIEAATFSFQSLLANFPASKYINDVSYYLGVAYFKKGEWKQSIAHTEEYLRSVPESKFFLAEAQYILALSYFNIEDYTKAKEVFSQLVSGSTGQKSLIRVSELNIAKCLYHLGRKEDAIDSFHSIIEKYHDYETAQDALIWLGDHYLENGLYEQAINSYTQVLKRFPGSEKRSIVHYELGQSYQALDKIDKAVEHYEQIDSSPDKKIYAKAQLAIADIFSRKVGPETAVETYHKITSNSPDFKRDAFMKIADIYFDSKQYDKVLEAYRQALSAKQGLSKISDAELQFHLGDTLEVLNEADQAVETYLKIPYLYPKETSWIVKAYLRIARIFEDDEKWEEAKITYNKIMNYKTEESKYAVERIEWIDKNVYSVEGL